jgi:histidine ammonia-lyase
MELDGYSLDIEKYKLIVIDGERVSINDNTIQRVQKSYLFLKSFAADKIIYGINTGFGPMAQYRIEDKDLIELQYNIIKSHSSGLNGFVSESDCRGILLARLNCLLQGFSGVHSELIVLLAEMLNHKISPCIPKHGGVGASGDLVQLAHLALVVIGEGPVYFKGKIVGSADAFNETGLVPFKIKLREGIAMMNGVSGMTGLAANCMILSVNAVQWSIAFSAMLNEIIESFDDHFSKELNQSKLHKGQQETAAIMRKLLADSKLIQSRNGHKFKIVEGEPLTKKVQEYYSLRCVPQVIGPILDTIKSARRVVEAELNSSSDNPVVDVEAQNVFHGGNFHGDYISIEMDKLKIAITKLSILAERQLNFLLNDKLNQILPPFINMGVLGLNFGLQGMQFTATSTTAENMTLSNPMSVHNIPNNNDNQDVVSMGFNSALIAGNVLNNTFEVLAIEAAAIIQAIDYLKMENKLATLTLEIYRTLRAVFPLILEDKPQYQNLEKLKSYLKSTNLLILND